MESTRIAPIRHCLFEDTMYENHWQFGTAYSAIMPTESNYRPNNKRRSPHIGCTPTTATLRQLNHCQYLVSGLDCCPVLVVQDLAFLMPRARWETFDCCPGYLETWGLRHIILEGYIWPRNLHNWHLVRHWSNGFHLDVSNQMDIRCIVLLADSPGRQMCVRQVWTIFYHVA